MTIVVKCVEYIEEIRAHTKIHTKLGHLVKQINNEFGGRALVSLSFVDGVRNYYSSAESFYTDGLLQ